VYGFDMSCIGAVALAEPLVDCGEWLPFLNAGATALVIGP
jgi:hypothetical protein